MRVERTTYSLGGCRSIQLSYEHALPCQTSYFNFKCQDNKKILLRRPRPRPRHLAPLRSSSLRSAAKCAPRRATIII